MEAAKDKKMSAPQQSSRYHFRKKILRRIKIEPGVKSKLSNTTRASFGQNNKVTLPISRGQVCANKYISVFLPHFFSSNEALRWSISVASNSHPQERARKHHHYCSTTIFQNQNFMESKTKAHLHANQTSQSQ